MGGKLVGFGPLFRSQIGVDFRECLAADHRQLTLEAALLSAQLLNSGGVIRPDRLKHVLANLPQLLPHGLRRVAGRLLLRLGLFLLGIGQVQVLSNSLPALLPPGILLRHRI